eukprot:1528746-Rhodomonas_salina.1
MGDVEKPMSYPSRRALERCPERTGSNQEADERVRQGRGRSVADALQVLWPQSRSPVAPFCPLLWSGRETGTKQYQATNARLS